MICDVYQVGDERDHLLLVAQGENGGWVINGAYYLDWGRQRGMKLTMVGHIDWPWKNEYDHENYNETIRRFLNGERAKFEKCECCDLSRWVNK